MHDVAPIAVRMAARMLITVWIQNFAISFFFIILNFIIYTKFFDLKVQSVALQS